MISELVDLPDPGVQPLVHPLDLPEARRAFRAHWLIATLTDPPVGLLGAALLWFATHSPVWPVIVGLLIVVIGWFARRPCLDTAWSFIPNRRQDRQRRLPLGWELVSRTLFAVLLAAGLLLVAIRLGRPDVVVEARECAFGVGAAYGVVVLGEFAVRSARGRSVRDTLLGLPLVIGVLGVTGAAYPILFGRTGVGSVSWLLWGFGSWLVLCVIALAWQYRNRRI
jgi:hypothetical protein